MVDQVILTDRSLRSDKRITFQPGDVVRFLTTHTGDDDDNGAATSGLQLDTTFDQERVWYHNMVTGEELEPVVIAPGHTCDLVVGSSGLLSTFTNAGPVLHLEISK